MWVVGMGMGMGRGFGHPHPHGGYSGVMCGYGCGYLWVNPLGL